MTSNPRYSMLDSMTLRCSRCGYQNDPQFRFCGMCGAALRPPESEDRKADVSEQASHMAEQTVGSNGSSFEPMPVEPLLAQLTAAQKFQSERAARGYSSEPRNQFYGPEPVHGQRTPVNVTGPSFLGLSESGDRGAEYLLEDEPHPGRKRTLLAALLLLIAVGAWMLHWRKTGSPWMFQSRAQSASTSSSSPQNIAMPSEVAPPMANQPKLEKPMTGVGDRPPTDDSAKAGDGASGKPLPAPDSSGNESSEKTPSDEGSDSRKQPASGTNAETSEAGSVQVPSATVQRRAVRGSTHTAALETSGLTAVAQNPAQDSLYIEGQKYLYGSSGVRQNCALAQQNLLAAAKNDNSKADSTLGTMYATGHCVPRDIPLAYRWFARALRSDPQNVRLERDAEILWNQMTPPEKQLALKNQ
jgi:hypothetical protein